MPYNNHKFITLAEATELIKRGKAAMRCKVTGKQLHGETDFTKSHPPTTLPGTIKRYYQLSTPKKGYQGVYYIYYVEVE